MPADEKTPAPGQRGEGQGISVAGGSNSKSTASNAGCPTLHIELYRNTARLRGGRILQLLDCQELSTRIGQAAEAESLESLLTLVDAEAKAVRELADRRAAVAGDGAPPQLRAVGA